MSENTNTPSPLPPAGWYPDPHNPSTQRYWNGEHWIYPEAAQPATAAPVAAVALDGKRRLPKLTWWQWVLVALGLLVLIAMIGGALGRAGASGTSTERGADRTSERESVVVADQTEEPVVEEPDTTVAVPGVVGKPMSEARALIEASGFTLTAGADTGEDWVVLTQEPTSGQRAEPGTAVSVTAEAPKPVYTLEQQNALKQAQSYLDFMSFSRQGLIDQMSSEYGSGYPVDVATWAVDTLAVDWNAEAVEQAQSYLDFSSFSRQGLYDQLTSPYGGQFTPEQANHALAAVGY